MLQFIRKFFFCHYAEETMQIHEKLMQSALFKGLPAAEIEKLLASVNTRVKKYKKGNTIASHGDKCEELLIVYEGIVKGEMLDISGKVVEVETIPAPRAIAAAFIFGTQNRFPVDAVAVEDVTLISIPKESLLRLMQLNAVVLTNYLDLIGNKTHFLSERIRFLSFKTIKEKLAHYILNLSKSGEKHVSIPKNQQELSEFFGVSRPALARVIGELEQNNIIECRRREIEIKNPGKLRQLLG